MWEFKGPAFDRVFAYGKAKAREIGYCDEAAVVKAHVRAWATSRVVKPGRNVQDQKMLNVEWITEGERIVGVKAHV